MGRPKLVCRLDGKKIIFGVVSSALSSSLRDVIVVTGRAEGLVVDALQGLTGDSKLRIVQNQNPEAGMASSITTGMSAVPHNAQGVMIILGDQGKLSSSVVDLLLAEFGDHPTAIVVPTIYGGDTTPVVFPAAFYPDLKRLSGDIGGRSIVQRAQDAVVRIELGGVYDDRDVDTEDDLKRLQEG
jgi:molybdenum cofactor cytidylyltransferase